MKKLTLSVLGIIMFWGAPEAEACSIDQNMLKLKSNYLIADIAQKYEFRVEHIEEIERLQYNYKTSEPDPNFFCPQVYQYAGTYKLAFRRHSTKKEGSREECSGTFHVTRKLDHRTGNPYPVVVVKEDEDDSMECSQL